MLKTCSRCGVPQSTDEFYNRPNGKPGLRTACKTCCRRSVTNWRHNNVDRHRKFNLCWQKNNKPRRKTITQRFHKNHKDVRNRQIKEWALNNPDKRKNEALKRKFGITLLEYDQLFLVQNEVCALCFKPRKVKYFAVDHDHACSNHETARACKFCIRGLLCDSCNWSTLPVLESRVHLQSDFLQQYLRQRPFLQIEVLQSQIPPLAQTPT